MTAFDDAERRIRAGTAEAFGRTYARICAYPVSLLLDAAGVGTAVKVLDVGTGTGTVAVAACARGATVTAVDADPDMVRLAREAAKDARVRAATLPSLPFADAHFDAVVANFVLNHVGRPLAALRELRRVTRPGGRVAVTIWAHPGGSGQKLIGRAVQAAGVSCFGHLIVRQPPAKIAEIKRHFDDLSSEFATPDGMLALPHAALLATGRARGSVATQSW
jgi:ubiquinone/menaquinone biosynthesis C-methylase UbiE